MKAGVRLAVFSVMVILAAGCAADAPELIASHPLSTPIGVYPEHAPVPPNPIVVYNAVLELEVSDIDRAARRSVGLVSEYGGYLVSSQIWYRDERRQATLVLAVPGHQFEAARRALLELGSLVSEKVSGRLVERGYWRGVEYAHITLHLLPKSPPWPSVHLPDWRPARTFTAAWGVFTSIFGFLVDILIWSFVVVGPFVLIAWVVRFWLRRRRSASG